MGAGQRRAVGLRGLTSSRAVGLGTPALRPLLLQGGVSPGSVDFLELHMDDCHGTGESGHIVYLLGQLCKLLSIKIPALQSSWWSVRASPARGCAFG